MNFAMPQLIPRHEALARIIAEGGSPVCLMCAIRDHKVGDTHVIHEDDEMLVTLPRYVRRWGHVMVMPKQHLTAFSAMDPSSYLRMSMLSFHCSRMVERIQKPRRVYVASTGSSAGEITQSSEHLHVHVIPLYDVDDKPSSIFSWAEGVYVAEREEWEELRSAFSAALKAEMESMPVRQGAFGKTTDGLCSNGSPAGS
jgi:histidine triad (HIT) family protein